MFKIIALVVLGGILFYGCTSTPPNREAEAVAAADGAVGRMDGNGKSTGASPQQGRTSRGGKEPAWVIDPYAIYRRDLFVAASSAGADRNQAEKNALGALIAIFGQSIQTDLKIVTNYSEAISKGVVPVSSENTSIQNAIKTSSEMDSLIGAEIGEVWISNKNEYYAVAVLEREKASTLYTDMISSNQRVITDLVTMSDEETYTLDGYSRYQLAATIADVNRVYANVLTIVGNTSAIVPGNLKKGDDYRLEVVNITKNIPIGITVAGNDQSDRIKGAFASALNKQGFRIGSTNSRYVLKVTVSLSEVLLQNQVNKFVRYVINANLTDTRDNSVLFPFTINGREGHLTLPEAENRAIVGAEKKITDTYSQELSVYLSKLLPNPK
jgi:hypothetical protein